MSEYSEVEQPFLAGLQSLDWDIIDQGPDIPCRHAIVSACLARYQCYHFLMDCD